MLIPLAIWQTELAFIHFFRYPK